MNILLYFTFFYFIFIVTYYFIYKEKLNQDNLFTISLNFIFLIILPIYFYFFEDYFLSFIISILLFLSSFLFNLKIKDAYHEIKWHPFLYFLITGFLLGYVLEVYFRI